MLVVAGRPVGAFYAFTPLLWLLVDLCVSTGGLASECPLLTAPPHSMEVGRFLASSGSLDVAS